jgi:hypothetical protein
VTRKLFALVLPLALLVAACGGDDDDDPTVGADTEDTAAEEGTTTTVDPGGTMEEGAAVEVPQEICDSFTTYEQTGDTTELFIIQGFADEMGMTDVSEAIDFLTSDPETETADQQAAFEGAHDYVRSELAVGGCTFD